MKRVPLSVLLPVAGILAAFVFASCSQNSTPTTPAEIAQKYGIPQDPFNSIVLQVYDDTYSDYQNNAPVLIWRLGLSASEWANQLDKDIFIMPPNSNTGTTFANESVLTDSSGNYVAVLGSWTNPNTGDAVDFGQYGVDWTLVNDPNPSSPVVYTDDFTAKGPDGTTTSGSDVTLAASSGTTFADQADFNFQYYSDSIVISETGSGSVSPNTYIEFDFYANSSATSPVAVLTLSATDAAKLNSNAAVVVQPTDLSTVYTNSGIASSTSGGTGLYCDYYTVVDPDSPSAYRTQYVYASYDNGTANTSGENFTGETYSSSASYSSSNPVVAPGSIAASMVPTGGGSSFVTAQQGAKPFVPRKLLKR